MDRNTVPEMDASDVFASRAFKPPKGYLKSVRPLNPLDPSAPTLVKIKLLPWRVAEINAEEASFMIDAQLTTQWLDPGLAFKPQAGQPDPLKYELYMPQRQIWVPDLSFPSRTGQREHSEEIDTAIVSSDGVVIRRQRIAVTLTTILDLRWFPYDKHVFRIPLECQLYKGIHLRLEDANSNADHLKPNPSWDIQYRRAVSEEYEYDCCPGEAWSRYVIELDVARRPQTYITSICFPLMAVVAVAYSNFHLDRDAMDTRINLVVTMILTMIALQVRGAVRPEPSPEPHPSPNSHSLDASPESQSEPQHEPQIPPPKPPGPDPNHPNPIEPKPRARTPSLTRSSPLNQLVLVEWMP